MGLALAGDFVPFDGSGRIASALLALPQMRLEVGRRRAGPTGQLPRLVFACFPIKRSVQRHRMRTRRSHLQHAHKSSSITGMGKILLSAGVVMLFLGGAVMAAAEDGGRQLYSKQSTWSATMLASRDNYLKWRSQRQATQPVTFGPWYAAASASREEFFRLAVPRKRC